jgi:catechol 2,3-dioxygenase-like lactoylglutathione lyase family enzyme
MAQEQVNVRYMVNNVQQSVDWYTAHLGFEEISNAAPAFAAPSRM